MRLTSFILMFTERPQQRRGAMRGRTEICAPLVTRPTTLEVKKGKYNSFFLDILIKTF